MPATAALAGMTGLIPVVVAGGIVMKFTEAAMPKSQKSRRRSKRRTPRQRTSSGFGNFSNLGL